MSNWLRSVGVKKGDSVAIYMPMVCEVSRNTEHTYIWDCV